MIVHALGDSILNCYYKDVIEIVKPCTEGSCVNTVVACWVLITSDYISQDLAKTSADPQVNFACFMHVFLSVNWHKQPRPRLLMFWLFRCTCVCTRRHLPWWILLFVHHFLLLSLVPRLALCPACFSPPTKQSGMRLHFGFHKNNNSKCKTSKKSR